MMVTIVSLAISLLGVLFLIFSMFPKRVGAEPHCRRCGYNLTAGTSQKCPECGTALEGKNIAIGQPRRRLGWRVVSVVLLLASGIGLYATFDRARWLSNAPYAVVSALARLDDRYSIDAIMELERRLTKRQLSTEQMASLIEECLKQQAAEPPPIFFRSWRHLLTTLHEGGALNPGQKQQFYSQILHKIELLPRPRLRAGQPIPLEVEHDLRADHPFLGWLNEAKIAGAGPSIDVRYWTAEDSKVYPLASSHPQFWMGDARALILFQPALDKEGTYDLSYDFQLYLLGGKGESGMAWPGPRVASPQFHIETKTTIIPVDAVEQIQLNHDPTLGARLRSNIYADLSYRPPDFGGGAHPAFYCQAPLPISIAFDVILVIHGEERKVGTWYAWKGSRYGVVYAEQIREADQVGDEVSIVLRYSDEAAQEGAGLEEVWAGELKFGPFPLRWPDWGE